MKKIIFIFFITVTALSACKKSKPDSIDNDFNWKFDKLSTKKELFINNDSTKSGMKLNLELNYPSYYKNDSILKLVQSAFSVAFGSDKYKGMTPEQAFRAQEKEVTERGLTYGKDAEGDGPDFGEYFENIITSVFDTTNNTITAKTEISSYTGGAHGSYQILYYNIDKRNGDILHEQNIFNADSAQISSLLKEYVKLSKNKMDAPVTILDENAIMPNGNFYFDKNGIVYVFNQYEIAPYSDGTIEVTVPYNKIEVLLKPEYQFLIKKEEEKKTE